MVKRMVVVGAVVLALGVGFASGWLAHQRGSSPAAPTPRESSAISAHPEPHEALKSVRVPSLVGVPVERAVDRLRKLGLNSRVWSGGVVTSSGNDILGQQPAAGSAVASGTKVRLYVP